MDDLTREEICLNLINIFISEIKSGNPNSGLSIAKIILSDGPNFRPEMLILLAESVVELSALAGSKDAKEYLVETWPTLKKASSKKTHQPDHSNVKHT